MSKKEIIIAGIICLLLAVLDLLGYPAQLFVNIELLDIDPIYFVLIINQWILIIIGILLIKLFCPTLKLGLNFKDFDKKIKMILLSSIIMFTISTLAFSLGLIGKYDNSPTFAKVFIEGIIYYISVAFIEELYIRGLLLNIIERLFKKNNNATIIAIVISSIIFGLGHIPGMIGQDIITIICRIIWTVSLGIYLGIIYKKTENLFIPILVHMVIDFCAISFCFVSKADYTLVMVICVAIGYASIAFIEFKKLLRNKKIEI